MITRELYLPRLEFGKTSMQLDGNSHLILETKDHRPMNLFCLDTSKIYVELDWSQVVLYSKDFLKNYFFNGESKSESEINHILDCDIKQMVDVPENYSRHYKVSFWIKIEQEVDAFRRNIYQVQKSRGLPTPKIRNAKIYINELLIENYV